jgi:multiple sugar transport system substrate-binding protein
MDENNNPNKPITRRKMVRLVGLGVSSAALLAACGDNTATTAPAAANTTAASAATTAASASTTAAGAATTAAAGGSATGKVVWASTKGGGTPKKLADAFNAKAGPVTVDFQEFANDSQKLHDQFVTVFGAKDTTYDIIAADIPWAPEFASAGFLMPLDKYVTPDVRKNFFEGSLQGATFKDKLYGLPWYQSLGVLFYRKDILDKAGLQPPKTFDEMTDMAAKLQTADMYGYVFAGFKNEGLSAMWLELLWGFGGEYWDASSGKVLVNSPEAEASLQWMVDVIYNKKVTPDKIITFKGPDLQATFAQGNAVFARAFATAISDFEKPESKVKGKWGAVPMLSAAGKPRSGSLGNWNLSISANSKNPDAAWKFIEYLTSLEAQKTMALNEGVLPSLQAAYNEPEIKTANAASPIFAEAFSTAKPRPVTPAYPQISTEVIQDLVTKVLSRQVTPKDAVKQMQTKTEEILAKFK